MSKLAVFFPGIGYTVDKPLLHYSRRIADEAGYEIKLLPYTGFPKKVKGDRARMVESFYSALQQVEEMLAEVDLTAYEDVLFVGKSVGTIVAARIAEKSGAADRIRLILYTPLDDTFRFPSEKRSPSPGPTTRGSEEKTAAYRSFAGKDRSPAP